MVHLSQAYQELFPFWCAPHSEERNKMEHFKIGSRIMNINSHTSEWIPFGLRGTVIGKQADSHLIVLFDEQFLGPCKDVVKQYPYRSARVAPQNVLNLTREFTSLAKEYF